MSIESQLREKLCKIEALFAGAGTAGERLAAEVATERVRARLSELGRQDPPIERQFSMPDQWARHLFAALCRRYGLKPYRYHRQRRTTVMVRIPKGFADRVLWPEFSGLGKALKTYLHEVRLRIRECQLFCVRGSREQLRVSSFFGLDIGSDKAIPSEPPALARLAWRAASGKEGWRSSPRSSPSEPHRPASGKRLPN